MKSMTETKGGDKQLIVDNYYLAAVTAINTKPNIRRLI